MSSLPNRKKKKRAKPEPPKAPRSPDQPDASSLWAVGFRSPTIPQKSLAHICRSLGTMLHSGVDIQNAIKMTGKKLSDPRAEQGMAEVHKSIRSRGEIAPSMREQGKRFPRLMTDLVEVGETTGSLPEVFRSLAKHYETNVRLKRQFLSAIAWPAFQLGAAILVIALLIYVLGILKSAPSGAKDEMSFDIFGLYGTSGAITWLVCTFGTVGALIVTYKLIVRNIAGRQFLDSWLMKIPVLGSCMRSFAIARFSWAFALTQQAGMSIKPSVHQSMNATSNGAFITAKDIVWRNLNEGENLTDSLEAARLFPEEFIQVVQVAETTGTVPEALDRLSPQFEEDAQRKLAALTAAAGWGVWAIVAVFVIFLILSIAMQYVGMLQNAAGGF
ncbi:MAG: type II secretion system F family protein [Planctomycetaceae bacterium]